MGSRSVNSYRDLDARKEVMNLAEMCYRLTATLPREELYGITGQIRRAAVSVLANIAEGYGRENRGEYIQFLRISQGSLKELETHLLLIVRVGLGAEETVQPLLDQCDRVGRILRALIRSLQR
ncbi:MAG: four helix bundle protein [Chthonomonadetes bacterium]|nr:four helix bundle protein [Chthonomonadetes bacterium]